jgi:hypothetical protein
MEGKAASKRERRKIGLGAEAHEGKSGGEEEEGAGEVRMRMDGWGPNNPIRFFAAGRMDVESRQHTAGGVPTDLEGLGRCWLTNGQTKAKQ